jgi:hypothetical protein
MSRIKKALEDYERASSVPEKEAALNTIINAVGTQSARHSLYGGAGGSTDETNPGNPQGQRLSSAADSLRYQARKELKRLRER